MSVPSGLDRAWWRVAAVTVGVGLVVAGFTAGVTQDDAKKLVQALQSQQQPTRPDVAACHAES